MNDKTSENGSLTNSQAADKAELLSKKKTIDQLFSKLAALYGNKFSDLWTGQNLQAVKATWADAIADLSPDELRCGINSLVVKGRAFPPTLPEFFVACRPPLTVPPATDHKGLDKLAAKLGVTTAGCTSYDGLRQRIFAEVDRRLVPSPMMQDIEQRLLG